MATDMVTRTQAGRQRAESEHLFFGIMTVVALAIVFAGFATSYYLWPVTRATHLASGVPIPPRFPLVVHVHAAAFTAWMLLFFAQVRLVGVGRTALHRRMGGVIAWLVPVLVATGLMTAVRGARDGWNPGAGSPDALSFMVVPFGDIVVFTVLVTAGFLFRHRVDIHKRLMLLATVGGLMPPAITRMPLVAGRPIPMFALQRNSARFGRPRFPARLEHSVVEPSCRAWHSGERLGTPCNRLERAVACLRRLDSVVITRMLGCPGRLPRFGGMEALPLSTRTIG